MKMIQKMLDNKRFVLWFDKYGRWTEFIFWTILASFGMMVATVKLLIQPSIQ